MIVGLLGFIGSGKGTAGDILKEMGFVPISFASSVKDVTSVMFDWPRHMLEGDTEESRKWREQPDAFWSEKIGKDFSPRYALQLMGTEVGRDVFYSNFWVDRLEKQIHPNKNYVITDVRFMNEIAFVKKQNGILIEIQRDVTPHWYDIAAKANRGDQKAEAFMKERSGVHDSEWRWIGGKIDYTIQNDKTLQVLKQNLIECLTKSYGQDIMKELK